ncbi:hypothetical protein GCM10022409_35020 [Hymenobacter glaciei]|uniref:Uncharacterized protein n=1 Tax=Hymenobacter glaciei TaxID=877209 RepID=A0ABP7UKQ3_9BACT
MQTAYDVVSKRFSYFELTTLKSEESAWFRRLLDNVRFYIHCQQTAPTARVYRAKDSAKQWAENDTRSRLEQLHAVFHACNTVPTAVFYLPTYLEMDGPLRKAVVGVEGVDFQDTEVMLPLLAGISDLGHLDIDFLTLLPVKDGLASSGLRYGKGVLQHFSAILSGEAVGELYDWQLPSQVNPDDDLLASLPKIGVRRVEKQEAASKLLQLMQDLWQLGEYRQRLSPDNIIEHQWLQELEQNTQNKAKSHLSIIKPNINGHAFNTLSECVNECLNQENTIQPSHLLSVMNDLVISEFA